jgi:hypothetical protein
MAIEKDFKEVENPKGTLTLKEALGILKGKRNITKVALWMCATQDGFKSKHIGQGRETFLIDEVKFRKWIADTIDSVPSSFLTVFKAAKELNMTTANVYVLVKKYGIKTGKFGRGEGKLYVDVTALKMVYKKRKEMA